MNNITMLRSILIEMLSDAAELGATAALSKLGLIRPYQSKSEAYKQYGESTIDRWIKEGLISVVKDGNHSSKCRINIQQIEAVAKASNRPSYGLIKER